MVQSETPSSDTPNISPTPGTDPHSFQSSSALPVPLRDIYFGQIVRWLAENGLTMHTPMKGETYVRQKIPRKKRTMPGSGTET